MKCAHRVITATLAVAAGCTSVGERPQDGGSGSRSIATAPSTAPAKPPPAKPPPAPPPPAPEPARPNDVELLVADFARLRRLQPSELAREQELARQAFNQIRNDNARMKLAMALSIPGAAASDELRALELLESLVKTPAAPLHSLAVLISAHVQEQRRLGSQIAGLQQNVQSLQQNVQTLQQNVQGLQQKLDAITKLERSLTGRAEPATVRRR